MFWVVMGYAAFVSLVGLARTDFHYPDVPSESRSEQIKENERIMERYKGDFYEPPTLCEQVRQFEPNQPARQYICHPERAQPPPPEPDPPPAVHLLLIKESTRIVRA